MNVLKIGLIPPAPPVPANILPPGGVEGGRGETIDAPKSPVIATARAPHDHGKVSAEGAEKAALLKQDARQREVGEVVEKVNDVLGAFGATSLRFTYDHERQLVIMQVVKTGEHSGQPAEVIRQIPPEELLSLAERLEELQGLLFDRQV